MLRVRKIYYRGSKYWLIQGDVGHSHEQRIESIPGTRWSRTKNGWLIPGTSTSWEAFKQCFKSSEYQIERAYFSPNLSGRKVRIEFEEMPTDASRVIVRLRKFTKRHLEVIRKVEGARYHVDVRYWSVPNEDELIEELRTALNA